MFGRIRSTVRARWKQAGSLFGAIFGTTTTTLSDATRQLVNTGSSGNADLFTGQGLLFDGSTQYINTGYIPSISQDYTFITVNDYGDANIFIQGYFTSTGNRFLINKLNSTTIRFAVHSGSLDVVHSLTSGGLHTVGISVIGTTAYCYIEGVNVGSFSFAYPASITVSMVLGAQDSGGIKNFVTGLGKDYYMIPEGMTDTHWSAHYANPERTLYFSGGTLSSDFLASGTLTAMSAGTGFWYPLCENTALGALATNAANGTTQTIVNYLVGMRTDATQSQYGYQRGLATVDANGVPTGLEAISVSATSLADAQTQFATFGLTLTDNSGQLELREA